jgi:thioredoxin-dependent peroxiredoxin
MTPDASMQQSTKPGVGKSMYGRKYLGVERSTFLVGADGRVERAWRKVKPSGHAAEVLATL